ncbi:MAG: M23 family metallopeptidase [Epsilonproteobacteria bacterium]|nr:M23 family metallopeptidase [Campylobacterota bacterium]
MRRKNNNKAVLFILALIAGIAGYIFTSDTFERDVPVVKIENNGYWNLKSPLKLTIDDLSGLKNFKVVLKTSKGVKEITSAIFNTPQIHVDYEIEAPRSIYNIKDKNVKLVVEATDASKWNFFSGNKVYKEVSLIVDKKRPKVSVLANSYKITKGGAALVVFKAVDPNINEIYIKTDFGKKFKVTPFYKDGYYISLLAWPINEKNFRAEVFVSDLAGNKVKAYIPLYLKDKAYKVSHISVSDKFLEGKVADLASEFDESADIEDPIERFKKVNEDVRAKNEELIHKLTSNVPDEMIDSFHVNKMYPLKNAKVVASFGDHRYYYYKGKLVSESYHMGLDLASNAMAKIHPQNGGKVVFADFNGLYGNMPLIHHGLGLYTLYGHCSTVLVNEGDEVKPRQVIARTGKSGYAMGDHLHFGVLIQGIEVRPQEWMDRKWIKLNITKVIRMAKKMIDKSE